VILLCLAAAVVLAHLPGFGCASLDQEIGLLKHNIFTFLSIFDMVLQIIMLSADRFYFLLLAWSWIHSMVKAWSIDDSNFKFTFFSGRSAN